MPVLKNARHERFAQELAKGKSADEAARTAELPLKPCTDLLGFYVYALVDPRDGRVFYIGKGRNKRYAAHWREMLVGAVSNARKFTRLCEIAKGGHRVQEVCIADRLSDAAACKLERMLIRTVGFDVLTNVVPGVRTEIERAHASGRDLIDRIWSFDEWLLCAKRSEGDIALYHFVRKALVENTNRLSALVAA